jgi:translation initiation factor 1
MKKHDEARLVYSTGGGRVCPGCERPVAECSCRKEPPPAPGDGIVRVARETGGRGGKSVTVVTGIRLPHQELTGLAKALKTRLGTGGTVREGTIEIQGDLREQVAAELKARGYTVRKSG